MLSVRCFIPTTGSANGTCCAWKKPWPISYAHMYKVHCFVAGVRQQPDSEKWKPTPTGLKEFGYASCWLAGVYDTGKCSKGLRSRDSCLKRKEAGDAPQLAVLPFELEQLNERRADWRLEQSGSKAGSLHLRQQD